MPTPKNDQQMQQETVKKQFQEKLCKLIYSYYNWEKLKEDYLVKTKKINSSEKLYLFEKNWLEKWKNSTNYQNLIDEIKKDRADTPSCPEEDLIKKFYEHRWMMNDDGNIGKMENKKFIEQNANNSTNILKKDIINNFDINFEIVNSDVYENYKEYVDIPIEINAKFSEGKILYELSVDEVNKIYFILLTFANDDDKNSDTMPLIYNLFFISHDPLAHKLLLDKIDSSNVDEIIKYFSINLENDMKEDKKYNVTIIHKKIDKKWIMNKKPKNEKSSLNMYSVINIECLKKEKTIINESYLKCFFLNLYNSDCLFNTALDKEKDINSKNYSPCKLIDKKWIEEFKQLFKYNINNKGNIPFNEIDFSKNDDYKKLLKKFPILTRKNYNEGNFYIINTNTFNCLLNFIDGLKENNEKFFKNCEIFLYDNKGFLIINNNIDNDAQNYSDDEFFIFETENYDINSKKTYNKIHLDLSNKNNISLLENIRKYNLNLENWEPLNAKIIIGEKNFYKKN